MSEYSEDYGEVPAKDTADAMPENQDRPVSYGEDSDLSIEETPAESEESSESTDTRQRTERDLHARYGEMQGKYQALDQKIDGLIQQNKQVSQLIIRRLESIMKWIPIRGKWLIVLLKNILL